MCNVLQKQAAETESSNFDFFCEVEETAQEGLTIAVSPPTEVLKVRFKFSHLDMAPVVPATCLFGKKYNFSALCIAHQVQYSQCRWVLADHAW